MKPNSKVLKLFRILELPEDFTKFVGLIDYEMLNFLNCHFCNFLQGSLMSNKIKRHVSVFGNRITSLKIYFGDLLSKFFATFQESMVQKACEEGRATMGLQETTELRHGSFPNQLLVNIYAGTSYQLLIFWNLEHNHLNGTSRLLIPPSITCEYLLISFSKF